jgi:hypothetical protein
MEPKLHRQQTIDHHGRTPAIIVARPSLEQPLSFALNLLHSLPKTDLTVGASHEIRMNSLQSTSFLSQGKVHGSTLLSHTQYFFLYPKFRKF